MRDHAAEMLKLERLFRGGKQRAALDAIYVCVCSVPQKPVPNWARQALARAMFDITMAKASSWDDVFGRPLRRGAKVVSIQKQRALQWKILARVEALRKQKPKPRNILQIVADEFKVSYGTCKRYSERARRLVQNSSV